MSVSLSPSDLEAIRQLLKLAGDNDLSELTITLRDGVSITIKSDDVDSSQPISHATHALPALETVVAPAPATQAQLGVAANRTPMPSPMMGIYYESASPGDPPFVKVGESIKVGQIIGLIEAMKVFSEVPSEVAGKVVELTARNGELVQQNQPLLYVEAD